MKFFDNDRFENANEEQTEKLSPIPLNSSLEIEGAVIAIRIVSGMRCHQRLLDRGQIKDADVLTLVGLELSDQSDSKLSAAQLREAMDRQRMRLEKKRKKRGDILDINVAKLGDMLKFTVAERMILRIAVIATRVAGFSDLFRMTTSVPIDLIRAMRHATGLTLTAVNAALSQSSCLRRSGFFERRQFSFVHNPLEVDTSVVSALLAPAFDSERFLRRLVREAPPSTLQMADFHHIADLQLVQRYLAKTAKGKSKGVNVLLYGAPGTGKTEFVRALATELDMKLYEVPNEDSTGEPISGSRRFSAYAICQNLLASRGGQFLLFDEIEDVFGGGGTSLLAMFSPGLRDPDELRKSWVNETLENNRVPAVWICNSLDAIDPAFLRRFDIVVEFRTPSRAVRKRVIERHFKSGDISDACAERLAEIGLLPPAQVERAARVSHIVGSRNAAIRDEEVERLIRSSLKAMGHRTPPAAVALPNHYDLAWVNTDHSLGQLTQGIARSGSARLCLYGPPGTGKTAFAHQLGRLVDRPVLAKRGSDLLSKWLGDTEARLNQAFEQAHEDGAILLIDEADGFLADRGSAKHSWEVTRVNELLTQMESFNGILVASTNRMETLDSAALRRFDFKVKFDYLTRLQRRAMLARVCGGMTGSSEECRDVMSSLDRLEQLTPGDFTNALRQIEITGGELSPERVATLLAQEVALKPAAKQRGIGFTADHASVSRTN